MNWVFFNNDELKLSLTELCKRGPGSSNNRWSKNLATLGEQQSKFSYFHIILYDECVEQKTANFVIISRCLSVCICDKSRKVFIYICIQLFTLIIIYNSCYSDDNTGPVICEDQGLNMERLVPSDVRISTDKSVTFTCTVVANLPANLNWYRNGQVCHIYESLFNKS